MVSAVYPKPISSSQASHFVYEIEKFSNNVLAPTTLLASMALGAARLYKQNISFDNFNFNVDDGLSAVAAISDLTAAGMNLNIRPASVIGNILRTVLNGMMASNDPNLQNIANQLFQFASTFIKFSWALSEQSDKRIARDNIKGFTKKFQFELSESGKWLGDLFKKEKYQKLGREFKTLGLKGFIGERTHSLLMGSAYTGLIGGLFLILGNALSSKANSDKKDLTKTQNKQQTKNDSIWHKIGWYFTKASLTLLTFSYLTKFLSPHYKKSNHAIAPFLSAITFGATATQAFVAENPTLAQYTRFLSYFSSILSWLETQKLSQRGLTSAGLK